jgi:RHS repeat-associated protein
LQFFNQPEGYIEPDGSGDYEYIYQYKDHLGNIRLSYTDANDDGTITVSSDPNVTEIVEENNYYPFGLKHKGYNFAQNRRNHKYGFGGKEEQDEFELGWIDITARNYSPELGRWMNLDPLADKYPKYSPYVYAHDNPINFVDFNGKSSDPVLLRVVYEAIHNSARRFAARRLKELLRQHNLPIPEELNTNYEQLLARIPNKIQYRLYEYSEINLDGFDHKIVVGKEIFDANIYFTPKKSRSLLEITEALPTRLNGNRYTGNATSAGYRMTLSKGKATIILISFDDEETHRKVEKAFYNFAFEEMRKLAKDIPGFDKSIDLEEERTYLSIDFADLSHHTKKGVATSNEKEEYERNYEKYNIHKSELSKLRDEIFKEFK